jgi:hypothetical protein
MYVFYILQHQILFSQNIVNKPPLTNLNVRRNDLRLPIHVSYSVRWTARYQYGVRGRNVKLQTAKCMPGDAATTKKPVRT